ncbi:MAG: hypothetical protein ACXVRD_08570 [Gaiellaceae bacterium]
MRRIVALLSLVALVAAAAAHAQGELPVPELLRVASRLTGIPTANAKATPKVVVLSPAALQSRAVKEVAARYPAAVQSYDTELYRALGLLGPAQKLQPLVSAAWVRRGEPVLDARTRTVYVARGADARGAALAGLVQALYADRYGLARTFAQDSDGSLALAAAADGASDLAVRNLHSAAAAPTPNMLASAFLGLEAQFVDAVGLRLVSNLFNVGGDTAVRSLLARPPVSTEQVLHIDKYLAHESPSPIELPADAAGFSLVRDDTFGELDVRALLAVYQVPRLDRVGSGWGGGMSAVYRSAVGDAVALRLDWDTSVDAAEWAEAVGTYVNEAFDADVPGLPETTSCSVESCWSLGGRSIAFAQDGARTALVFGPGVEAAAELAGALAR